MRATIEAYRAAANALFAKASREDFPPPVTVLPIATLWKQYLCLALRRIVALGRQLLDEPPGLLMQTRSSDLWIQALPHIAKLGRSEHDVARIQAALYVLTVDEATPEGLEEISCELTLSDLHLQMESVAATLAEITTELEARLAVRGWEN